MRAKNTKIEKLNETQNEKRKTDNGIKINEYKNR